MGAGVHPQGQMGDVADIAGFHFADPVEINLGITRPDRQLRGDREGNIVDFQKSLLNWN